MLLPGCCGRPARAQCERQTRAALPAPPIFRSAISGVHSISARKHRHSHALPLDSGGSRVSWWTALAAAALLLDDDHPAHAEAVGDHPEALGEERLAQRHAHFSASGERLEHAVGVCFVLGIEGEREALEFRLALRAAVGCHHRRIAEAKKRMHYLVL